MPRRDAGHAERQDGIFNQSGGATLLAVTHEGDSYKATFQLAVQLT